MPKVPKKSKTPEPEWARPIRELRRKLGLNQVELGLKLHIELGNLAGDPNCWHFWGRAGLRSENLLRVIPAMRESLQKSRLPDLEIVHAGSGARRTHLKKQSLSQFPF
jgi:hypothetical protein